jgi:hypothetical protein
MHKLLSMLVIFCCLDVTAQSFSDSELLVERQAFFQSCHADARHRVTYTEEGTGAFCRCAATIFYKNMSVGFVDLLRSGDLAHPQIFRRVQDVQRYCADWTQKQQRESPFASLLRDRSERDQSGAPSTSYQSVPQPMPATQSLDGMNCSFDSGGLIRCNNGLTCVRDQGGLIRCNNGQVMQTDQGGVTRSNNGIAATTVIPGVARYQDGTTSQTDSGGLTRFSDGTYCQPVIGGLIKCTKR